MTPDQYILWVSNTYQVTTGLGSPAHQAGQALLPIIRDWAGNNLLGVSYSGSYAKGTAIRGLTDVDLFISLGHSTPEILKDIYGKLGQYLKGRGFVPRFQNVSVKVFQGGLSVDLVPGRKQAGLTTDHSLYKRKADTWTQTNVNRHISIVKDSGRIHEIRVIKLWRLLNGLEFPSFYLELTVINALQGCLRNQPASNVLRALRYIASNLASARVVDPANSNNVISDDLTLDEKRRVAVQASNSVRQPTWDKIIGLNA